MFKTLFAYFINMENASVKIYIFRTFFILTACIRAIAYVTTKLVTSSVVTTVVYSSRNLI